MAFDVFEPNTETLVSGIPATLPLGLASRTIVTTKWTYGSQSVVMDASTRAEEKLHYVVPPEGTFDWAPGTPGMWRFAIDTLEDEKGATAQNLAAFDALPYGATIGLHYQKNRLRYKDCCGQTEWVPGPTRLYRRTKSLPPPGAPPGRYTEIIEEDVNLNGPPPF